jgi:hypothetical protein
MEKAPKKTKTINISTTSSKKAAQTKKAPVKKVQETRSFDIKPIKKKPDEKKVVEKKPVEKKIVEKKPVERKTVEKKPIERKVAEREAPVKRVSNKKASTKRNPNPNNLPAIRTKKKSIGKKIVLNVLFFIFVFIIAIVAGYNAVFYLFTI